MKEVYNELQEDKQEKIGNLSKGYFEKLFPSLKEQKPGKELYHWIFFFQILILIYTIFGWSLMIRAQASIEKAFSITFLDFEMVCFFAVQFILIVIDRHLSVFNKSQLRETEYIRSSDDVVSSKVMLQNFDITYEPRYQDIMLSPEVVEIVEKKQQELED